MSQNIRNSNCCCCHCYCHSNNFQNYNINNEPEKTQSIQQNVENNTDSIAPTTDKKKFSKKIHNNYFENTNPIFKNYLNDNTLNKNKNQYFAKTINYMNDILNNETKIRNPSSFSTSPDFEKKFLRSGRDYLNNRKRDLFSQDKFDNRNDSSLKNGKLYGINHNNDRLLTLLRKVPKHDKKIFSKNVIPMYNKYKSIKKNKSLFKLNGSNKTKLNAYLSNCNCIRGYNYKKINSFVMPANDFDKVAKTMSNIKF